QVPSRIGAHVVHVAAAEPKSCLSEVFGLRIEKPSSVRNTRGAEGIAIASLERSSDPRRDEPAHTGHDPYAGDWKGGDGVKGQAIEPAGLNHHRGAGEEFPARVEVDGHLIVAQPGDGGRIATGVELTTCGSSIGQGLESLHRPISTGGKNQRSAA